MRGGIGKLPAMPPPPNIGPELGGGGTIISGCAAAPAAATRVALLAVADDASGRVGKPPLAEDCAAAALWAADAAAADSLLVSPDGRAAAGLPYETKLLTSPDKGGSDPVGRSARHETERAALSEGRGALTARLQLGSDSATRAHACWACVEAWHASMHGVTGRRWANGWRSSCNAANGGNVNSDLVLRDGLRATYRGRGPQQRRPAG